MQSSLHHTVFPRSPPIGGTMLARRLFSSSTSSTFPQSHFGQPVYFRTAASFFFFFSSPDLDGQTFCILEDVEMTLFVVVADAWTLFYSSMDDLFELWNQPRRSVVLGLQTGSLFC